MGSYVVHLFAGTLIRTDYSYAALFDRLSDGVANPRCCNHINIRWLGSFIIVFCLLNRNCFKAH